MYVCLCNGHTSHQLETLARSGVASVEHAYEILGGSPACRRCIDSAGAILADAGPDAPDRRGVTDLAMAPETAEFSP